MDPLQESLTHLVPAVIVNVQRAAFRNKEQRVGRHHRSEDAREICEERGVQREEGKNNNPAQERGEGIGGQTDLHEIVGELIILPGKSLVLGDDAEILHDHAENGHRQHKASVVEMLLKTYPQENPALEVVSGIVFWTVRGFGSRGSHDRSFILVPDVPRLLHRLRIGSFGCGWRRRSRGSR